MIHTISVFISQDLCKNLIHTHLSCYSLGVGLDYFCWGGGGVEGHIFDRIGFEDFSSPGIDRRSGCHTCPHFFSVYSLVFSENSFNSLHGG